MLIEKNEAINMKLNPTIPPNTTSMDVSNIPSTLTFQLLMDNTQKSMGPLFFPYDAIKNNCQSFIIAIFKSNNILTPAIQDFVKQDVGKLFTNFKNTKKLMNTVTKIGEKVDIIKKGGRLNQKPVVEDYSNIVNHLVSHVTDPKEPIDPRDVKQSIGFINKIGRIKSHTNTYMPRKQKITMMMGQGLEGNAGIGGKGLGQDMGYESDSSSDTEGCGLYAGKQGYGLSPSGGGMGSGAVHVVHHHHYYGGVPEEMTGEGINWKKVGRTLKKTFTPVGKEIVKIGKPILKDISHKYLPKLASEAGEALGMAGADFIGQPELAPMAADLGKSLGSKLGSAADKKVQGLGVMRRGRFEKGSQAAKEWAAAMRKA
jgi:hypothetical protein